MSPVYFNLFTETRMAKIKQFISTYGEKENRFFFLDSTRLKRAAGSCESNIIQGLLWSVLDVDHGTHLLFR